MIFKYKIGDKVLDIWSGDMAIVLQRRIEYGRKYYRLDNGVIRFEDYLI